MYCASDRFGFEDVCDLYHVCLRPRRWLRTVAHPFPRLTLSSAPISLSAGRPHLRAGQRLQGDPPDPLG